MQLENIFCMERSLPQADLTENFYSVVSNLKENLSEIETTNKHLPIEQRFDKDEQKYLSKIVQSIEFFNQPTFEATLQEVGPEFKDELLPYFVAPILILAVSGEYTLIVMHARKKADTASFEKYKENLNRLWQISSRLPLDNLIEKILAKNH